MKKKILFLVLLLFSFPMVSKATERCTYPVYTPLATGENKTLLGYVRARYNYGWYGGQSPKDAIYDYSADLSTADDKWLPLSNNDINDYASLKEYKVYIDPIDFFETAAEEINDCPPAYIIYDSDIKALKIVFSKKKVEGKKTDSYLSVKSIKKESTNDDIQWTTGSNSDDEQHGCDVVPEVVIKWIKIVLNFVKYIALVLVIILGTLDFIKAAGSGEADAMKKAGQSFLKRIIAVILLFLLPMLVDLILHLINLYGSTEDCFGILE